MKHRLSKIQEEALHKLAEHEKEFARNIGRNDLGRNDVKTRSFKVSGRTNRPQDYNINANTFNSLKRWAVERVFTKSWGISSHYYSYPYQLTDKAWEYLGEDRPAPGIDEPEFNYQDFVKSLDTGRIYKISSWYFSIETGQMIYVLEGTFGKRKAYGNKLVLVEPDNLV